MNTLSEKYAYIIDYFQKNNPDASSELQFTNAFQLLVATLLAAQCTDKRINQVTPALFNQYPDAITMSKATVPELFFYIKSVSYPNNKALHLSEMSKMLVEKFNGEVPRTMEELTQLPGVGRKTANVVLAFAFQQPSMPVDTHVFRVSNRLGLVQHATTPLEVEKQLVANIPLQVISSAHHWLLLHGRYTCTARKPHCEACPFTSYCDFFNQENK